MQRWQVAEGILLLRRPAIAGACGFARPVGAGGLVRGVGRLISDLRPWKEVAAAGVRGRSRRLLRFFCLPGCFNAETPLLELVAHDVARPVIRADFFEKAVVGDLPVAYRIAAVAKLGRNLRLGLREQVWILLQDLDDVVCLKL